jgi:hypothetical protein
LATNEIDTLTQFGVGLHHTFLDIFLDLTNKRVYWQGKGRKIFFIDYIGGSKVTRISPLVNGLLEGKFKDSVYFQEKNFRYINVMNIPSRILSHRIKIDKSAIRDLVVVHSSLQLIGELQNLYQYY